MDIGALHVRRLPTWASYLVPNREGTFEPKNAGLHLSDGHIERRAKATFLPY